MSKNAGWSARHSSDYEGKRFVVDGDLIELYAYEYGVFQPDVAKDFHTEPLEEYESRWLDEWVKHHDRMLQRTCDAIEAENTKLRELLLDCWDFSHLMHGAMAARFYELGLIDDGEARELGIEVGE